MSKLRLEITKGETVRYISHLDYSRTMERALRRAKLPVAYSEGFNPHMKIAFGSALSLGVTSDTEYLDVELKDDMAVADFSAALAGHLPAGIELKAVREIAAGQAALMAVVNLTSYRVTLPLPEELTTAAVEECVRRFNEALEVLFVKESPKGRRQIDVKEYMVGDVVTTVVPEGIALDMTIRITPGGSVKPSAVLTVLADQFGLAVNQSAALINRTGLYVSDGVHRRSPLDIGVG
ncbi:MAG: TIGR03936 family radical SAM-associated protein [Negativicutes bacterium]|nr:TIGR03936 family radical SAM-associated protein [Negativicutes bacterium]